MYTMLITKYSTLILATYLHAAVAIVGQYLTELVLLLNILQMAHWNTNLPPIITQVDNGVFNLCGGQKLQIFQQQNNIKKYVLAEKSLAHYK